MKAVAIIPARGGSKRIPKKNIKPFLGKPMIAYTIEAIRASEVFHDIIVSTDCEEIANVAISLGAKVPELREKELADHFTGILPVLKAEVLKYRLTQDVVGCFYATAPFLNRDSIRDAFQTFSVKSLEKDYIVTITTYPHPAQRALSIKSGVAFVNGAFGQTRSQDLEELYHDAAQFIMGMGFSFAESRPIFGDRTLPFIIPRYLVQDIDTVEDWVRAEWMYKAMRQSS